jgi:hypothetical protein
MLLGDGHGPVSLDPAVVQALGLELDVEAQQLAARVLRLARIAERSAELVKRSAEIEERLPPAVER